MRQLILVFLFLICGALVNAKAPLQFLKEQIKSDTRIQKKTLSLALQQRCIKYFSDLDQNSAQTILECRKEVHSFINVLDITVIPGPATVAYATELVKLMNQVSTHYALMELESELQLSEAKPFQLYQTLFQLFKNDQKVVQFLAVLFQDTTQQPAHIHYLQNLEDSKSKLFLSNLTLLKKVHNMFVDLQRTRTWKKDYQIYPLSIEQSDLKISSTQYHFYVISYATLKMAKEVRSKNADKIIFIGTAFDYLYERFYRFSLDAVFNDEMSLSKKSSTDVMLAFVAALYGIGVHPGSLHSVPDLQKNPDQFFRTTLQDLKTFFP